MFDFEFFAAIAQHPKLNIKNAVQTLDVLAKCYIYDEVFAPIAFQPFYLIANRFKDDSSFSNYVLKLAKVLFPNLNRVNSSL